MANGHLLLSGHAWRHQPNHVQQARTAASPASSAARISGRAPSIKCASISRQAIGAGLVQQQQRQQAAGGPDQVLGRAVGAGYQIKRGV